MIPLIYVDDTLISSTILFYMILFTKFFIMCQKYKTSIEYSNRRYNSSQNFHK